jgi:hypothetical protein
MSLIKINDVSDFFKKENNKWIFTGTKLEIFIPKVYQDRNMLVLGENAVCLGIFQLRINDTFFTNMMFLGRLTIEFITSRNEVEDGYPYIVLELAKDSIFINNATLVKDNNLIYEIFVMFLALGKIPPFISYDMIQKLFDNDNNHCGVSLNINHTIFEMIYAHMFRDMNDPYLFYRLTSMDKPPQIVPINQISHGPISTTSRIVGSYLNEGITAALIDDTPHVSSKIENLLRA